MGHLFRLRIVYTVFADVSAFLDGATTAVAEDSFAPAGSTGAASETESLIFIQVVIVVEISFAFQDGSPPSRFIITLF